MQSNVQRPSWAAGDLLRGDPMRVGAWTESSDARAVGRCVVLILAGAGCYGAAMGWWRAPEQGLFTAIKFPLIVLLTALGNSLLNAMLAPLLGLNIPFRRSFNAILMSFAIAALILGAFSPLAAFMVWNAPPLEAARSGMTYSLIMLGHVIVIAFSGTAANLRLWSLLRAWSGGRPVANRVLVAWLAGNLFLGSQLSWIFRPFIGAPGLPLQFLREHPLEGNFYEAVFRSVTRLFTTN